MCKEINNLILQQIFNYEGQKKKQNKKKAPVLLPTRKEKIVEIGKGEKILGNPINGQIHTVFLKNGQTYFFN